MTTPTAPMSRLEDLRRRLHLLPDAAGPSSAGAVVIAIEGPGAWAPLAALGQRLQQDAGLPAPALAVSGRGALMLWLALAEPVAVAEARDWAQRLVARHLGDLPAHRVRVWPDGSGQALPEVPARAPDGPECDERWSAFVAPDLAPLFDATPWLDIPPGDEAQAGLLAALEPATPAQWQAARRWLHEPQPAGASDAPAAPSAPGDGTLAQPGLARTDDPAQFLREVMNDTRTPLALRIEAAKALLHAPAR